MLDCVREALDDDDYIVIISGESKRSKTLNSGYLGSRNDEERSEMRYVMRIAESSESSKL